MEGFFISNYSTILCFNHLITLMKKKYFYLSFIAFGLLTLMSCSSDDNTPTPEPQQPTNYLLGKWNATSLHSKLEIDGKLIYDDLDKKGSMSGVVMHYDFKADKTVDYYMYLPATNESEAKKYSGTVKYEIKENQLTFEHIPKKYSILLLDNKNLTIHTKNEVNIEEKQFKTEEIEKYERIK